KPATNFTTESSVLLRLLSQRRSNWQHPPFVIWISTFVIWPMPTYDYVCDACDHEFELFQSITEPVKRKCPECGKNKLRRLIGTGAAIMFKGSGFYKTDYRSDSYKKRAESEKPSDKSGEARSDGAKSESKPETKSDSSSGGKAQHKKSAAKENKHLFPSKPFLSPMKIAILIAVNLFLFVRLPLWFLLFPGHLYASKQNKGGSGLGNALQEL